MGLFRDAGKRLERFKRTVEDVAKDEAEYECEECGELVYADRDDCPECGAAAVVARDPGTGNEPADGDRDSEADGEVPDDGTEDGGERSVEGRDAPGNDESGASRSAERGTSPADEDDARRD